MNLYRILKQSDISSLKISVVITDNQVAFSTNIGDRSITHYDLVKEIEMRMYPDLTNFEREEKRDENLHIFLMDLGAMISFPDNGKISSPQVSMMIDFIKDLSKYNREVPAPKRIPISIDGPVRIKDLFDISELDRKVLKEWKKYSRPSKELDKEEIIGDKYSNNIFRRIIR